MTSYTGTDIAYGGCSKSAYGGYLQSSTDIAYDPTQSLVLTERMVLPIRYENSGTDITYCPTHSHSESVMDAKWPVVAEVLQQHTGAAYRSSTQ
eukprot:1455832-Rhodomonas_salina.2